MGIGFLQILNHLSGFFSVKSKVRGRIYSLIGFIANFYILYISYRLVVNGRSRGWLILFLFLILLYFSVLNIIYYFTNKPVKWDISPLVNRLLGEKEEEVSNSNREKRLNIPVNGLYNPDQVLTTTIFIDNFQKSNLQKLFLSMQQNGLIGNSYGNMGQEEIYSFLSRHSALPSNYPGNLLPYFSLRFSLNKLIIYGGLNEMNAFPIGTITKIGLQDALLALRDYRFYLSSVVVFSNENYILDPKSQQIKKVFLPLSLKAEVAYKKRENIEK